MQNSYSNLSYSPTHPTDLTKKVSTHVKQLDIWNPLVIYLAAVGAEEASCVCMLNDLENGVKSKELKETSELNVE